MKPAPRRGGEGEISILPVMNLVSILIPFLLMTTQFVHLSAIDTLAPVLAAPGDPAEGSEDAVTLLVILGSRGITIAGADPVVYPQGAPAEAPLSRPPTLPCAGACTSVDSYDWRGLTATLSRIKDAWPEEEDLLLLPEDDLPYEVIVAAMDASRADRGARGLDGRPRALFPRVVLASGPL